MYEPPLSNETTARTDPVGIPVAFAFLLVRQRSSINPPTDKMLKNKRGKEYVVVRRHLLGEPFSG